METRIMGISNKGTDASNRAARAEYNKEDARAAAPAGASTLYPIASIGTYMAPNHGAPAATLARRGRALSARELVRSEGSEQVRAEERRGGEGRPVASRGEGIDPREGAAWKPSESAWRRARALMLSSSSDPIKLSSQSGSTIT